MNNKNEVKERIDKLRQAIDKHRYNYHVLDKETISAEALDSLKKELFDLETEFPELITSDSPTQRIAGEPLEEFQKVSHFIPMISFQDAFSEEDMTDWKERIEKYSKKEINNFFCEYKIDGLAIELVYRDSVLEVASTRGDGNTGEDVTENIKTIEAIPLRLRSPQHFSDEEKNLSDSPDWLEEKKDLIVRGEVFISDKEFLRINKLREKNNETLYANPRNLAAGSIRQLDPKIVAGRKLSFFVYDLTANLKDSETTNPFNAKTHKQKHQLLRALGFKTTNEKVAQGLKEVFEFREKANKDRKEVGYQIDGIAVFVNDNTLFNQLGVVGKAPRGAIAYKFPLQKATTKVEDIKVQIGRTGSATPVAILSPVSVGGVTISRATLHNEDEINRLGLKIKDTVVVGRAGDVIPYITEVLKDLRTGKEKSFNFPKTCPICGSQIIKPEEEVVRRCSNKDCGAQKKESIKHFTSKSAFNIEGLGEKVIEKLIDEGLLLDLADIFKIKKGDLVSLERFGEKSADNLINSINESKKISLARFIYALGIRQVGERTATDIANYFKSLEAIKKATEEDLLSINDIGPIATKAVLDWFKDEKNQKLLDQLIKSGIIIENPKIKDNLKGKRFAFTGTLETLSRDEAKERVTSLGGEVTSSISKNIDYLVVGENPGTKKEKAQKEGVKIITEEEFKKML